MVKIGWKPQIRERMAHQRNCLCAVIRFLEKFGEFKARGEYYANWMLVGHSGSEYRGEVRAGLGRTGEVVGGGGKRKMTKCDFDLPD